MIRSTNLSWTIRPGLVLVTVPSALASAHADACQAAILAEHRFRTGQIRLFGRWVDEPREISWCGKLPYTYAHKCLDPAPWSPVAQSLREQLVTLGSDLGLLHYPDSLNHLLINHYRDGRDSMGYHQDNEPELGANPVIVSLSFGATRRFTLRPHPKSGIQSAPIRLNLAHGDVLMMAGESQHVWQHQVPKTRLTVGPRLNLTFRTIRQVTKL